MFPQEWPLVTVSKLWNSLIILNTHELPKQDDVQHELTFILLNIILLRRSLCVFELINEFQKLLTLTQRPF